jgi:hypothetical protein
MADDLQPYDATDPVAEQNAKRDEARKVRENAQVMQSILHTKPGRAWLNDILENCHIFSTPFVPGQPDTTAFAMGEENIGKRLMMAAIDADASGYMKMLAERKAEEQRQQEVRNREEAKRQKQSEEDSVAFKMQGFDLPAPGTEMPPLVPGGKAE